MKKKLGTTLMSLAATVAAYTNETKSQAYLLLTNNKPIQAFMSYHEAAWNGWFYLLLALGPYFGMYVTQRSIHIPTIWLLATLAAYNWLIPDVPPFIFYLISAVWVMSVLIKLLSPVYTR